MTDFIQTVRVKKILMYGEPWTGGSVAISDGCSQSKAGSLNSRVGMFCDSYRDAIKEAQTVPIRDLFRATPIRPERLQTV